MMSRRFFHINKIVSASVQSSSLAKLRKSTGYSMSNCKKALELHADLKKAEEWLHEEAKRQGWSKIAKFEHKSAAQGLIGICIKDSMAAMVEVNCETDFVAKNTEFQSFVSKVLSSCLDHTQTYNQVSGEACAKFYLDSSCLNMLSSNSSTLGDLAASATGKFGEKTIIRRAVCFKAENHVHLNSFSHPSIACVDHPNSSLGKYGGMIAFSSGTTNSEASKEFLSDLGRQLCQHIVGMNPTILGNIEDIKLAAKESEITNEELGAKLLEPDQRKEDIVLSENLQELERTSDDTEMKNEDEKLVDTNETRLVHQQFLLDPSICVGEFLLKHSVEILDFQRFECGEVIN